MTGYGNVKNFLLPNTTPQDLIWAEFEQVSPNLGKGGTFPHNSALFFRG